MVNIWWKIVWMWWCIITQIEFNSNIVYILFYKRSESLKNLRDIDFAGPNGCRRLCELRRRHQNSIFNRLLLKTAFHCLLSSTFVTFFIHWPLSPVASSVSWCRSCFVCSAHIKYTIRTYRPLPKCVDIPPPSRVLNIHFVISHFAVWHYVWYSMQ